MNKDFLRKGKVANMKHTFQKICVILCVLAIPFFFHVDCKAAQQIVKVGYFDLGSYYQKQGNKLVKSYDKAYLEEIGKYTGMKFEYVDCKTWNQAINMLEAHEIDLLGTMQWTREREEKYEVCDASYGYTVAELGALKKSSYIYGDYEAMNGAKVGYIDGYVIGNQLEEWMKEHGISLKVRTYKSQTKLEKALENGEIDLIATNAHVTHSEWNIVEKFAYAPFYFASWKGNGKIIDDISQAIIKLNIHQSNFEDNLMKKYFPIMVNSPFNKEEKMCIEKNLTYQVYFDTDTKPIVWYDSKKQEMKGVLVNICSQLEKNTGIKFDIKPRTDSVNTKKETTVTYKTLYYEEGKDVSQETGVTNAILEQSFEMYHRVGDKYKKGKDYKIAIVKNRDGLKNYVQTQYPKCTIVEYESPEICMRRVLEREADLTFIDTHIADDVIITNSLNQLTAVPLTQKNLGIALQFHGEDAQLLSEIVDKGIPLIDSDKVNDTMLKYAANTTPNMTLSYILQDHFRLFVVGCIAIIVILFVCISLLLYAKMMRKEKEKIEEVNYERSDFFARMSHDLRTPMNGILGMLELIRGTSDMNEVQSNTSKAMQSGKYMLSLINDTLDLQRLESKKITLDPEFVCIKDFMDNLLEMLRPSMEAKQIDLKLKTLNFNENSFIKIDAVRVNQIFVNIISNAVKFTPEGGTIQITVENLRRKGNIAHGKVVISDTGIGMNKDFLRHNLFHPYSQERNKITNKYAGSGLGLAIVKNLIELMEGSIRVDSDPGEGTTVTIYLDFEFASEDKVDSKIQKKHNNIDEWTTLLKDKRILLCEDHPLNAEIATRLLEKVGCKVTVAEDGAQGVKLFQESQIGEFDAVLMDIRMPVMDGLEATKTIRNLPREDAKKVAIIAMTANAYESDRKSSREAGMDAHLAKPIDVNMMYEVIVEYT
ncbi:MAG: ATP-binding protein [Anaerostipes sp.]|nr:ATP-binding protein [Anaerostipes sp.]